MNISSSLSCGQKEIKRIIEENMDMFNSLQLNSEDYNRFCETIIKTFWQNRIITNDVIVSRSVSTRNGFKGSSINATCLEKPDEIKKFLMKKCLSYNEIELCYYLQDNDTIEQWKKYPLFTFGNKKHNIGILFDMVSNNKKVNNFDLDLCFDSKNSLWSVGSGGSHRTIASILLNEIVYYPTLITVL